MTDVYYRKVLIDELLKVYPYPIIWYNRQTTSQLIAMYSNRPVKRPSSMSKVKVNTEHTRKYEDGEWWILTEGHGWEIETD